MPLVKRGSLYFLVSLLMFLVFIPLINFSECSFRPHGNIKHKTGSCFAVFIIVVTGEKLMSREFEPFIFFLLNFLLYIGVKPINNAVIVSDGQQRDSAIHTHFKSFI